MKFLFIRFHKIGCKFNSENVDEMSTTNYELDTKKYFTTFDSS